MESKTKAPRLTAYLESKQGLRAITVPREQWDSLQANSAQVVIIDVEATPIRGVGAEGSLIAAVASQGSTGGGRISVYRHDPKDDPTPVNVDHYSVFTDLASHPRLQEFAVAASTSVNANLLQHLLRNVFLVREEPGDDHWLTEVPSSVTAAIRIEARGG